MALFDSLLERRGLKSSPLPLWKLKISDSEYEELKVLLRTAANSPDGYQFKYYPRECLLLFAEYWRREYHDGFHNKQAVFETLHADVSNDDNARIEGLYNSAKRGAKVLKIELYENGTTQYLDSMLYQGGLPMRLVTISDKNSVWDRFTRGLVNRHIDFDELQLGKIATVNQSMKEFCNSLIDGVEKEQYMLMPFYCKDEYDPWFVFLKALAHQERTRQRQLHQFSLDWEFFVDERGNSLSAKYIVKGLQRLPDEFLNAQQLSSRQFFSIQVRVNGHAVDTFDYQNRFCRYNVISKHPYHDGDVVSLYLHDKEQAHLSDNLDLSVPHILFREKDGKYSLGNKLGSCRSLLLIPDGWAIMDHNLPVRDLQWEGAVLHGVFLHESFDGIITVTSSDGSITFGADAKLFWTEIASSPLYLPDIIEPVYDASSIRFSLCSDGDALPQTVRDNEVEFRAKGESVWTSSAPYGEVIARVKSRNGEYVTPVSFTNVGELSIVFLGADKDTCYLRLSWPYGKVHCKEGTLKYNNIWSIEKSSCDDPRRMHFILVPTGHAGAQFIISVRAPFKDFSILDNDGNQVCSGYQIPYSDVDKYQYHIVGQGIKAYTYGDTRRELRWDADKLYVYEDGRFLRPIPFEGSFLTLFDSREVFRSLLDKTSKGILDASVRVYFEIDQYRKMTLYVKESPYRITQEANGVLSIQDGNNRPVDYRHALKLFKLDDPKAEQIAIRYSDDGFVLPEDLSHWEKALVTGRTRGRILPSLVTWGSSPTLEERKSFRDESIRRITSEMNNAKLGGEVWNRIVSWFNLSQREDIPASSILDLYCLSQHGNALLVLAFQLFINCKNEEDRDTLKGQLLSFGQDLAFQWYWIKPFSANLMLSIQGSIEWESPFLKGVYVDWAFNKGMDLCEVMNDISNDEIFTPKLFSCLWEILDAFKSWLTDLFITSLVDSYDASLDESVLIETANGIAGKEAIVPITNEDDVYFVQNQENLDESVNSFFACFSEPGKVHNEAWFFQRVNAVAAHMKGKIDLLREHDSIRRSIIYCQKSCPFIFLIELNNKLAH